MVDYSYFAEGDHTIFNYPYEKHCTEIFKEVDDFIAFQKEVRALSSLKVTYYEAELLRVYKTIDVKIN